jgi:hypothetical protein
VRFRSERGTAAIETPLALVLLLVPVALMVITIPAWPERQTVARAAATQAARTAVLADSWDEATAAGEDTVARSGANYGLPAGDLTVEWEGTLLRGGTVTARVTVRMPALVVPGLGRIGAWSWTASHSELVDRYRSFG